MGSRFLLVPPARAGAGRKPRQDSTAYFLYGIARKKKENYNGLSIPLFLLRSKSIWTPPSELSRQAEQDYFT
jgi:hypothetical protein